MDITLYIDQSNSANINYEFLETGIFSVVDTIPDSKFFYPVFLTHTNPFIADVKIPEGILSKIHSQECIVLAVHYKEGYAWFTYEEIISQLQITNGLKDSDIVFATGTSNKSTRYKSVVLDCWEPASFSKNFIKEQRAGRSAVLNSSSRPYKFICLNRACHPHRFATVAGLYPYKDQGLLSFHNAEYSLNTNVYRGTSFELFLSKYPNQSLSWLDLGLPIDTTLNLPDYLENQSPKDSLIIVDEHVDKFYQSYLHIVTETSVNNVFFSEKTFKPIKYYQPFVLINGANSLRYLREMGYKTFEKYIDESYDIEQESDKRISKAINSALEFIKQKGLDSIMKDMYPILEHNYNNFIARCRNFQQDLHHNISKVLE